MTTTLKETAVVAALAETLYDFLPGSGNPLWKGHVSFRTVASRTGVGDFCQPGSKLPMITALLELTHQHRPSRFERLVNEIVREGMVYRRKKGSPITADELGRIAGLALQLGYRIEELFEGSLRATAGDPIANATRLAKDIAAAEAVAVSKRQHVMSELASLQQEFFSLCEMVDRQRAGVSLERVLTRLFQLSNLKPRDAFRVVGEQIDGSFELDHETYLVEAKWTRDPLDEQPLLVFRGKIEGKSAFTRGVFISVNGYTTPAQHAIARGKQPTFFALDGYDLTMILQSDMELADFLRRRYRLLAEEGRIFVTYRDVLAS